MCYKAFNFHTWEQREEKGWADAGPGKPRPLGGGGVGVCGLCRGQNERGSGRGPKEANWGSEQEARKGCCYSQQLTALKQAGPWACLDLNTSHPNHAGTTRGGLTTHSEPDSTVRQAQGRTGLSGHNQTPERPGHIAAKAGPPNLG